MKIFTLLACLLGASTAFAEDLTGEQIYAKKCLSCHGKNGEGTKEHPELLIGDRSLEKLSAYVAKSMPEDKPGTCVGEDARKVSAYIYEAFYSRAAQARNKPPRIELARLTIGQFRNAIADLIASFKEPQKVDPRQGIHTEFYN